VAIASWERLSVFRLLVDLPERDVDTFAPRALHHLDEADDGTLRRTLECYLDHAGHTQAAATALSLHRVTLYYRLDRIKQVTGIDLSDGAQRLELHVWLKLLRLRGRFAARAAPHPATGGWCRRSRANGPRDRARLAVTAAL